MDRINYFINATGTLPLNTPKPKLASLFFLPDHITPIINKTEVIDSYNITIYLNAPFSPLLNLFCHQAIYIISPKSTSATNYIQLDGDLIGTGPFMLDSYILGKEVQFTRWEGYWRNLAHFEKMIFIQVNDLGYIPPGEELVIEADWYTQFFPWAWCCGEEPPESITVKDFTTDTGIPDLEYVYLGFNNEVYNATWRKAMSSAINYSYIINYIRYGSAVRANSPISPGFGAAYNSSAQVNYNLTQARMVMQSMGYGTGFVNDSQWISTAEGASPFLTVNYTYNTGNTFREDLLNILIEWYKNIGIKVVDNGVSWRQYLIYLTETPEYLGLYSYAFVPLYFDPFYILNELFNPFSKENTAQVNDPWLTNQISLALNTTDDSLRNIIYKDIQGYLTEIGFFYAPLYHSKIYFIHSVNIYNPIYNVLELLEVYYMYRI